MARFTHPAIGGTGSSEDGTWVVEGGTLNGTQPTFNGNPMFSGRWTRFDNLVHFSIDVDMDNITNFGTGQYYVKLPFVSKSNYLLSNGCLHDISTGDEYAILGHVQANSDILTLLTTTSNGKQNPFTNSVPVNLSTADNFHIAGTYECVVVL
jgi:hypothetical protein